MEGEELLKCPQVADTAENEDAKHVSGLSTILVATIQEAKDRISQIENIFCHQLYPNIQSKSKSLQKIYYEARKDAEDEYKLNEKGLLLQMEKLSETLKQKTDEVNVGKEVKLNLEHIIRSKELMLVDKDNTLKELKERSELLVNKQETMTLEVERLQSELMTKSNKLNREMELEDKLQSKSSLIAQKDKELAEHEVKKKELTDKLERTLEDVVELQSKCNENTAEIARGKDLHKNLLQMIELRDSERRQNEQLLEKYEKENRFLLDKVENLENKIDKIQRVLQEKNKELEDGVNLREHLLQQIDLYKLESETRGKKQEDLEKQNDSLLAKLKDLQHNVDKLQLNLQERSNESDEGMVLHEKLLQQIKARDSELLSEKKKLKEMVMAYKKLKSQYNFLSAKVPPTKMRDDAEAKLNQTPIKLAVTGHTDERDTLEDGNGAAPLQQTKSLTPSNILGAPGGIRILKSCPPAGSKRNATYWRDTRSHQSKNGPDLHDDFLDTPLENLRGNQGKASKSEILPEDMAVVDSDDETHDMNVKSSSKKEKLAPLRLGVSRFKFVEPVRKKAEREKLKGMECKQCRKFYDAVLPREGNEFSGIKKLRCEHHDGVSRHRYKNEPPLTPDGFWNIGFETET